MTTFNNEFESLIVAVGAASSELDAFEDLLAALEPQCGLSIVFVQKQGKEFEATQLDQLSRRSAVPVLEAKHGMMLAPSTVYLSPSHVLLEIANGTLRLLPKDRHPTHSPMDHFLHSLAEDQAERSIGIDLSHDGVEGVFGLKSITDAGGLTFVKRTETASGVSLPGSSETNYPADHVLGPAEIAVELMKQVLYLNACCSNASQLSLSQQIEDAIPTVAEILFGNTRHNFQHYNISTVVRRIQRRMRVWKLTKVEGYLELLQRNNLESIALFRELHICVTAFFRERDAIVEALESSNSELANLFRSNRNGSISIDNELVIRNFTRAATERKARELNLTFISEIQSIMESTLDADAVWNKTLARIANHLSLSRCLLVELDGENKIAHIFHEYAADDLTSILGSYRIADFHSEQEEISCAMGLPIIIDDTQSTLRSKDSARLFETFQINALLNATYSSSHKEVRFVLSACKQQVYNWNANEVEFLQELASRIFVRLERMRAESAMRESESRFRDLADNMSQFAWEADENGLIVWYNQRWFDYTGTTLDEMRGWGWVRVHHPDHLERVVKRLKQSWETGEVWEDTFPLRSKFGEYRWFLSRAVPIRSHTGKILRWFGTNTDITEAKQAAEAMRIGEARLQRIISGASLGIAFAQASGKVTGANDAALAMLGLTRTDFEGNCFNWKEAVRPSDSNKAEAIIRRLTETGSMSPMEMSLSRRDGTNIAVMVSALVVDEVEDEHVVFLVDLTQQKKYEESLDEARQQAEIANRSKSEFLANMSHEIRTPMTAVLGYTDLLLAKEYDGEKSTFLRTIKRNGRFLLDIINDILDLSKIEAGKMEVARERFSPLELVADVRSLMDVRASEKHLKFDIEYDGPVPIEIESDPKRLKQILVNLLGNAIKFTESGSVKLIIRFLSEDSYRMQFEVIDTGIGMSEEQQECLFKPFSQGDPSVNRRFGGSGLGLTISLRLAMMLGGRISVQSQVGHGSSFVFTIDAGDVSQITLIAPKLESVIETDPARDTCVQLDCNVLVVDDRRDVRFLTKHFLAKAGATVELAEDGQHALDFFDRIHNGEIPSVDLILLDMQMPRLDGYQTATELRKRGFSKPIIALTADAMHGDMRRCIECGCDSYLSKPIDGNKLVTMVAQYIKKE